MALPKRRHSSTRRDKRRGQWKLEAPSVSRCNHCGSAKRPHYVCPQCGYYNNEEIVAVHE
ncbi:MAG: 50S ribosomal protein L32 [Candidatus Eisenbacteria bacterium]|nr:50S ribosomal protein L32 [Candidatus Eisenbacteria bacterium]